MEKNNLEKELEDFVVGIQKRESNKYDEFGFAMDDVMHASKNEYLKEEGDFGMEKFLEE